ncbi:ISL3 family transposase [Streptomyces sp. NBC_00984]|uniref:ISL3 family transposase n=1 Tax=Streptomyces sp. NBC_00984 TaxID=2903700 RepID=UPI00386703FE|nr:ISL3 family transposase [Streptomyces sp. NBC_00984]
MSVDDLFAVLFPHFAHLQVELVRATGRMVRIQARGRQPSAACPGCGTVSKRVHSGYERKMSDTAISNQQTILHLRVRRFFCGSSDCPKKTFAEQIPGLTFRHGRCTTLLRTIREVIALALGGRAGARLAELRAIGLGKDAMLRLIRALPDPEVGPVRVLGVDDFALKKGHHYGTVLIDMENRRPVGLLPERSADALASWLTRHPGVEVICRDRARYYAEGADQGAADAVQVADRFHLWQNLGDAAARLVTRLRPQWTPPPPEKPEVTVPEKPEGLRAQRIRARHAAVHALMNRGMSIGGIVAELRLDPKTVRKNMRATTADELIGSSPTGRQSSLDGHAAYLAARWAEGCTSTSRLHRELADRGLSVSERTVRRFLLRLQENAKPTTRPPVPKVREVTGLILTHPDNRLEPDRVVLKELRDRSSDLDAACYLVARFAEILVHRQGQEKLERWTHDAEQSQHPELRGFASGLRKDWDAVMAGLTLHWNSGAVEGHVNRIKMLKRQMFGRAKHDLLRKRVLLTH